MADFNSPDTIRVRMTLDVTYLLNGEDPDDTHASRPCFAPCNVHPLVIWGR